MFNLSKFLTFKVESAYDYEYDLPMKKNFYIPKIYNANGNLSRRWYVYFSYQNPKTRRLKRVTPFYGEAHKYKTKEYRLSVLTSYRKKLLQLLKAGFNPFEDNTNLYSKKTQKENNQALKQEALEPNIEEQKTSLSF